MEIRKAERAKAKLRVGVSGPSGSGKSYSAMLMAKAIASSMEKIVVIDTEQGSADLIANLGAFSVLRMNDDPKDETPFSPERYIEAIRMCEKAGFEVIIIDSITHEWDGKGGCLEANDKIAATKYRGNTWAAWADTTPRHQRFIDAIVGSTCHVITTVRNKVETMQTDDKKVKKVGTKEITREGFEYELTVNFNIDRDKHYASASKDRTQLFDKRDPFIITEATGKELLAWANDGTDPAEIEEKKRAALAEKQKLADISAIKTRILQITKDLGLDASKLPKETVMAEITAFIKKTTNDDYRSDLSLAELTTIRDHLKLTLEDRGKVAPVQQELAAPEPEDLGKVAPVQQELAAPEPEDLGKVAPVQQELAAPEPEDLGI